MTDRSHRWGVALLAAVAAASCVSTSYGLFAVPAFAAFVAAVVVSTGYGGLGPGLLTAVVGWVFSNVAFVDPVGELSLHRTALGLLGAYLLPAGLAGLAEIGPSRPADG